MPPVPERFSDQGQVLSRHDRMTSHGVPEIVNSKRAETGNAADRLLASDKTVLMPALGVFRKIIHWCYLSKSTQIEY